MHKHKIKHCKAIMCIRWYLKRSYRTYNTRLSVGMEYEESFLQSFLQLINFKRKCIQQSKMPREYQYQCEYEAIGVKI